ncbi:MAG: diacylglycerol/polyprenol kinase family protein [Methanobacteriota archaeon]
MFQNDVVGVVLVYLYVAVLVVCTEKILSKKYPVASRKFLHIMTGNIAFILPVFQTREMMAFVAAGPFILFTFLMSPYSPFKKIRGKTSEAGHGLGLVYYAITWTVLAYVFFEYRVIIAMGILAMSYGDGLASIIGIRYGRRTYRIFRDTKSYVGSLAMFLVTFLVLIVAFLFYAVPVTTILLGYLLWIAALATLVEGITPFGLDNLSVPFITAFFYWGFLVR